ncbi:unnamed protein product [Peronospora destructor]|uniref:Uncharacterized protein n=1 Tax=Peronospora destructor TaxID=86335 RepID=A0AAV0VD52_9STRA|nr:unnamed protein product [Peronospora destructor]
MMAKLICAIVGGGSAFLVDIDAGQLVQFFLAKDDKGRGTWLTETEVKQAVRIRVTKEDVAAGIVPVHVLVKLPEPIVYAASLAAKVQLLTAYALMSQ